MYRWLCLVLASVVAARAEQMKTAIQGTHCAKNQVVNKITVYEDGAIEAECGPIPCGSSGESCSDDQAACRADVNVFSGMKWAKNGQSLQLRCCSLSVGNKIYVGTDLVTLGSFYTGGLVQKKDMYGNGGPEYDFVANVRTEQNGVRVWVYRIMCAAAPEPGTQPRQQQQAQEEPQAAAPTIRDGSNFAFEKRREYLLKQLSGGQPQQDERVAGAAAEFSNDEPAESVSAPVSPVNPLQYRPPAQARQKDSPVPQRLQKHASEQQSTAPRI